MRLYYLLFQDEWQLTLGVGVGEVLVRTGSFALPQALLGFSLSLLGVASVSPSFRLPQYLQCLWYQILAGVGYGFLHQILGNVVWFQKPDIGRV